MITQNELSESGRTRNATWYTLTTAG